MASELTSSPVCQNFVELMKEFIRPDFKLGRSRVLYTDWIIAK